MIELFANDGDGMRWGRNYRNAGYYAQILLWTSVPMWMLTLATLAAGLWGISASLREEGTASAGSGGLSHSFLLRNQLRPASMMCVGTGLL